LLSWRRYPEQVFNNTGRRETHKNALVRTGATKLSSTLMSLYLQALDHSPVYQMFFDDFIDIFLIDIGVPDVIWVDHGDRSFAATIQATGDIHPDRAFAFGYTQFFGALFGVISHCLRIILLTTLGSVLAQIGAKKDVPLIVSHKL